MEEYINDIPYFLFFVFLGVIVNFLYNGHKRAKLTKKRVAREFIGAIWISAILFVILDEFFVLSRLFIYVSCSLVGFGNSKFIDFFSQDLFEFLIRQGKQAIKNLVSNVKSSGRDSYWDRGIDRGFDYVEDRYRRPEDRERDRGEDQYDDYPEDNETTRRNGNR